MAISASEGWQGRRDSNPQPIDLESTALPLELLPLGSRVRRLPLGSATGPTSTKGVANGRPGGKGALAPPRASSRHGNRHPALPQAFAHQNSRHASAPLARAKALEAAVRAASLNRPAKRRSTTTPAAPAAAGRLPRAARRRGCARDRSRFQNPIEYYGHTIARSVRRGEVRYAVLIQVPDHDRVGCGAYPELHR